MTQLWRVHIGAHKTATTHLQHLLELNADRLLSHGVDVLSFERTTSQIRANGRRVGSRRQGVGAMLAGLLNRKDLPASGPPFTEISRGQPVTILSHEDQLGFTQDLLRPHLYAGSERWSVLDRLAKEVDLEIFLSIRSFDTLYVSVFCEILKPFHDARRRVDERRHNFRAQPPSWSELAERVAARFPTARVRVWCFEDYIAHPGFVLEALTGRGIDDFVTGEVPQKTRSPSPKAIAMAEGLDRALPLPERMRQVQRLYDDHPKLPGEKLNLFDEEEVAWLRRCHLDDLDRLARSDRVTFLSP